MSRLSEMIKELCPDGVEYRKLEDVLKICNGSDYKKFGEGDIPVYGSGGIMTYIDTYVYDKPSVLIPRKGSLDKLYYVDVPFWTVDTIFYTKISEEVLPKYIFYYLQSQHLERLNKAGGVPSLTQSILNKVIIPVPPLAIQNEIVKLLDNFTELTAELTAELQLRKKQYSFYRDSLLNFSRDDAEVEWMLVGDIGDVTKLAGFEFTKYVKYVDRGETIALRGLNVKGQLDLTDVKYIDGSDFSKLERSKLCKGDMLFTYVGTVGQVALVDCDDKYYLAPNVARIRFKNNVVTSRYMHYLFQTDYFMVKQVGKYAKTSSMKNLTMENIRKFQVPIPPLETQAKIVSILDRFDALCHDLTQGLPAEIAARKKQYEYYRDKLLTFPRKGA